MIDRDERRFKRTACMRHQDVAKALGLVNNQGKPQPPSTVEGVEYRQGDEAGNGQGVPLYYTGPACPLCFKTVTYRAGDRWGI